MLSTDEEEGEIAESQEDKDEVSEDEKEKELEESGLHVEEDRAIRQYLPRNSKNKHKFLTMAVQRTREEGPSDLNKTKKPRNAK